jgi:hypothetical protein
MAINTGIHVPAVTALRVFHYFQMAIGDIDHSQRKINGCG